MNKQCIETQTEHQRVLVETGVNTLAVSSISEATQTSTRVSGVRSMAIQVNFLGEGDGGGGISPLHKAASSLSMLSVRQVS